MAEGFIKLHRQIEDWEWYDDLPTFKLWIHILIKAAWKPKKWHGIDIERGGYLTSRNHLSLETGLTEQQVRTALEKLEKTGEISVEATNLYTLIKVHNYGKYQMLENDEQPTNNQRVTNNQPSGNQVVTNEQPSSNQRVTTTNKDNKEKKEKKENKYNSRYASGNNYFNSYPVKIDAPQYFKDQQSGKLKQDDTPATEEQIANINELMSLMYRKESDDE